ncbi:MAG: hypothetical protein PSV16_08370 [Flavobacterium sp.]|nr:hypothetical protein [Flavobacterium sp.]
MKNLKYFFSLLFVMLILSCTKEDDGTEYLTDADAPSNLSAIFTISQDNSGNVTIRPNSDGATSYAIVFGDSTVEEGIVLPGETIDHIYPEGTFQVKIIGTAVNGLKTEFVQPLTVSFQQPQNLNATVTAGSNLSVNVSATADLETFFQVYYGEDPNQTPIDFMEGQTVSHTYAAPGSYEVRVVALSGGAAFAEQTQTIVITNLAPAPDPTAPASSVISLFSGVYTNVPVDTWKTSWSQANLDDVDIAGNAAKKYTNLNFVGIETTAPMINATTMTHFHTDVWSSDFTTFKVKLVDFGANAAYGGGDDVEHEITFNNLAHETWVSLDIPLSSFTGLTTRAHIAQLIYAGAPSGNTTVYVDNVYFYNQNGTLTTPAPTPPVYAPANVISMFSDAYTNVPVDTWKTVWSSATFEDVLIAGNATKKYSTLNFVGVEATTTPINATAMTYFHTDVWSSDFTTFKIKLVDFGANGTFAGGDDVEHEITYTAPAQNTWISLDIPLSSFTGLTTRAHIAQLIYVGAPTGNNTIYIDNVYFHN